MVHRVEGQGFRQAEGLLGGVMLDDLGVEADYTHAGAAYGNPRHMDDLKRSVAKKYVQALMLRTPAGGGLL